MSNGRNADPNIVAEKKTRIRDIQVAPLNSLADRIATSVGLPHGHVPYVDPNQGGTKARVPVLLDNPSTEDGKHGAPTTQLVGLATRRRTPTPTATAPDTRSHGQVNAPRLVTTRMNHHHPLDRRLQSE